MSETLSEIQSEAPAQTPLERLYTFLVYLGYIAERVPVSAEVKFESLQVGIDKYAEGQEPDPLDEDQPIFAVAQLFFNEDVLIGPDFEDLQEEMEISSTLQFLVELPLSFKGLPAGRTLEGLRLLLSCSQIVPIGYFGINSEDAVYFNYALKASDQNIPIPLIIEVLELMSFFIAEFSPVIKDLIETDKSLPELVRALETNLTSAAQAAVQPQPSPDPHP